VRNWEREYPRWPGLSTVERHFGSWSRGLEAAGFAARGRSGGADPLVERVESARRLAQTGVSTSEIADLLGVSPRTVRGYLTAGVCRACGGPAITSSLCRTCAPGRRPAWGPGDVIDAIQAWVYECGRLPRSEDWRPAADPGTKWADEYPRWPSYMTVRTLFGSWNAGLEAAGFRPVRRYWDRDSIIAAMRVFADERGCAPRVREMDEDTLLPAAATVRHEFGSLAEALAASGLEPRRRRWDRAAITGALRSFHEAQGRAPTSRDWNHSTSEHPHSTTVLQQFGSWSDAIRAAGLSQDA
jgi:hypothetical protein